MVGHLDLQGRRPAGRLLEESFPSALRGMLSLVRTTSPSMHRTHLLGSHND